MSTPFQVTQSFEATTFLGNTAGIVESEVSAKFSRKSGASYGVVAIKQ